MKILGIERDSSACNYYRIALPLSKMAEHGYAEVTTVSDGHELETERAFLALLEADVVVFHRAANNEWFNFIKKCRENGKIIVTDYDDDPFNTSPWNPYYRYIGTAEVEYKWPDGKKEFLWKDGVHGFDIERNIMRRDQFRACFKNSDIVSTTTPILQESLKKINPNTVVLPNLIDFGFYPECRLVKKEVRIGWQGGSSHYEDLYMIKDAVVRILKEFSNVKFVFVGDTRFKGLFKDAPQDQIEYHYWVSHETYPYKLVLSNLDIGLCPITDNEFNRNKSAIKFFEYSVALATTIASNIPPYSPVIKKDTGILAGEDDWYSAMADLVSNPARRRRLADNAYDDVYENYNIDKGVHLWNETYQSLIKQEVTV